MIAEKSGEPLTFSRLADEAQVSRRTLYTHWGTIERVIGEAVSLRADQAEIDPTSLTPREVLRALLNRTRDRLTDPVTHLAIASLVAQASADDKAAEVLESMSTDRLGEYAALLGELTHDEYSQIVGPLFFNSLVRNEPISDEFLEEQVDRGIAILKLS